jgi:hypothetical protein
MPDSRGSKPGPALSHGPWAGLATAAAVASVAFAAQSVVHELIGHGSGCVFSGGKPIFVDSIVFRCARDSRLIDGCGPAANIVFGLWAFLAFRRSREFTPGSYFLWLFAAINLLVVTGYLLQSGATNRGDWASVVDALRPAAVWRTAIAAGGIVLYYVTLRLLCRSMIVVVNRGGLKRGDLRPLMFSAYLTSGLLAMASGAFNPDGATLLLRNAFAESFLALIGLLLVPQIVQRSAMGSDQAGSMESSRGWIICGSIVALVFVFVLGPGIKLRVPSADRQPRAANRGLPGMALPGMALPGMALVTGG